MNSKWYMLAMLAISLVFVQGCGPPATSNQPWDRPLPGNGSPAYKSDGMTPSNPAPQL